MPRPKWMRAERYLGSWLLVGAGSDDAKHLFRFTDDMVNFALSLGLTVKGDLKKSIKRGLIEYVRGN